VQFPWYSVAVEERAGEVLVTLPPTNWRRAAWRAAIIAAVWALLTLGAWLIKPVPLHLLRAMPGVVLVCLLPFYLPLLRRLLLNANLPWLRLDKKQGVVHLFAGSRQVPLANVVAICDVIVPGKTDNEGDAIDRTYELQLLLRKPNGTEFVLLAGGWHDSAAKRLAPVTGEIAKRLGIPHYSVDVVGGTITEHSQPTSISG